MKFLANALCSHSTHEMKTDIFKVSNMTTITEETAKEVQSQDSDGEFH